MENERPTIITSDTATQSARKADKSIMKRVILPIFIAIIVIEVIIGAKTLLSPISTSIGQGKQAQPLSDGKISLVSAQSNYRVGQTIPVSVRVSTGGHATDGTDLSLKYDPNYLDIKSSSNFLKGTIYTEYPVVSIDSKAGIVRVSGIDSSKSDAFTGIGLFGEFIFTAKKPGSTSVSVVYQPNTTTESNIIETATAKNLLTSSSSLNLIIGTTPPSSTSASAPACSQRVYQLCKNGDGLTGTEWCTSSDDPSACNVGCFKQQFGSEQGCNVINATTPAQ